MGQTQEGYHYTGTVNIWTEDGIVNSGVIQAWQELQAIPSYTERHQREAVRQFRGDACESCNNIICTCGDD